MAAPLEEELLYAPGLTSAQRECGWKRSTGTRQKQKQRQKTLGKEGENLAKLGSYTEDDFVDGRAFLDSQFEFQSDFHRELRSQSRRERKPKLLQNIQWAAQRNLRDDISRRFCRSFPCAL